jgi:hypothetical protein
LSWLSFPSSPVLLSCSGILSGQTRLSCPVSAVMRQMSCPGWPVLSVLSRQFCHSCTVPYLLLFCPIRHVQVKLLSLSRLTCFGYPFLADLLRLSFPGYLVPVLPSTALITWRIFVSSIPLCL